MSRSSSSFPFITVILAVEAVIVVAPVVATAITATIIVVKGKLKALLICIHVVTHQRCVTGYDRTNNSTNILITSTTTAIIAVAFIAISNVVNGEVS